MADEDNELDVIDYKGANDTFVWRSPITDFNIGTQLIVHEAQEALFFANGQALDLFGPGRHTLTTENIPMVRNFFNKATGDKTPFKTEVYYINKAYQPNITWGTPQKVEYKDPQINDLLSVGASGAIGVRVSDSRKFIIKIVANEYSFDQALFAQKFKDLYLLPNIKEALVKPLISGEFSVVDINSKLTEYGTQIRTLIAPIFDDYGLDVFGFSIANIALPTEPAFERLKEIMSFESRALYADQQVTLERKAQEKLAQETYIQGNAETDVIARRQQMLGYTYQDETARKVGEKMAENEAKGEYMNAGIGLGMMGGVMGGVGTMMGNVVNTAMSPTNEQNQNVPQNAQQNVQQNAPQAGETPNQNMQGVDITSQVPDKLRKGVTYSDAPPPNNSAFTEKLDKLVALKNSGILTEQEFNAQKASLLKEL
ncbi:MAG: SPFH domain-containing protein [Bifidobacteriaceae bacterium]|jgi:membrane protease subunit (stomatin/prohibitin family)|nr:SPFH domain-containing protein [Bifidobacteriaceae bacterium]